MLSILASVVFRQAGGISDSDLSIVKRLDDVDTALAWREEVLAALPLDMSTDALVERGYFSTREDEFTNWVHYGDWLSVDDNAVLDPARPESYLFEITEDGEAELAAVVFMLPRPYTYQNTPNIAAGMGVWHTHPTTCLAGDPLVNPLDGHVDGACLKGPNFPDRLMIHVWVKPNVCGPFAVILIEPDPTLTPAAQQHVLERVAGADKDGMIPACEKDLARRVWPESFS